MFFRLFLKECRQTLKCTTYYIIIIFIIIFYATQYGGFEMVSKPKPNQADYGMTYSKDERVIMNCTLNVMVSEYLANQYATYPIGFYKGVVLNEEKQSKMFDIMLELTGLGEEKLQKTLDDIRNVPYGAQAQIDLTVAEDISYEKFLDLMKEADELLGGGSRYKESSVALNAYVPMTYEEALDEYNEITQNGRLSGANARLFCDYMGIELAIIPVFLAVTRALRDKRAKASQIIYARRAGSASIIMSRYWSIVVMIMLPVLIIAAYLTVQCLYYTSGEGLAVDGLAFFKYSIGWLLPAVMISSAVGILLTELTETAIAIIVMGVWWIISLYMTNSNIGGEYGWNLIPRHNTLGNYQIFHDNFKMLVINRLSYALLAVLLAAATVFIYELKRRGRLNIHGRKASNNQSES